MPTADKRLRPAMPLAEMVTWELAEYRERLEDALALDPIPTYYLPREQLQKQLDAVLAEQAERGRIREGKLWPASA